MPYRSSGGVDPEGADTGYKGIGGGGAGSGVGVSLGYSWDSLLVACHSYYSDSWVRLLVVVEPCFRCFACLLCRDHPVARVLVVGGCCCLMGGEIRGRGGWQEQRGERE